MVKMRGGYGLKPLAGLAFFVLVLAVLVSSITYRTSLSGKAASSTSPAKEIILDSDMASDIDDPMAVAELNQLMRRGEVKILAVVTNVAEDYSPAAIDAINHWFHNDNIPIGANKIAKTANLTGNTRNSPFNFQVADKFKYSGNTINGIVKQRKDYPDALTVLKQVLNTAVAQNKKVDILSVGFMTNLRELLQNDPGLVSRAVNRLVFMGGHYPTAINTGSCGLNEWNFCRDPYSAWYVMTNWPTEMVGTSYAFGAPVMTGPSLKRDVNTDPLALVWSLTGTQQTNGKRSAWDSLTTLYAVRGLYPDGSTTPLFNIAAPNGTNVVTAATGYNQWYSTPGRVSYLGHGTDTAPLVKAVENVANMTNEKCKFNARSLYTDPITLREVDEISVGNYNYTRFGGNNVTAFGWQRVDLTTTDTNINGTNYKSVANAPCYLKSTCVFDSRTRYTDYYKKLTTGVTMGPKFYNWTETIGWWSDAQAQSTNHDIASVKRWRGTYKLTGKDANGKDVWEWVNDNNKHAPCHDTGTDGCKFDARTVLYRKIYDTVTKKWVETKDYDETIVVGSNIYTYSQVGNTKTWNPITHDLATNDVYSLDVNSPCYYNRKNGTKCYISDLMQYYDRNNNWAEYVTVDDGTTLLYYNRNLGNAWWSVDDRRIGYTTRFLEKDGPCWFW